MRIHSLLYLALSLLLLASCAHDNDIASDDNGGKRDFEGVTANAASKVFEGGSRSALTFDWNKGMVFSWKDGDQLTILPESNNLMYAVYAIKNGQNTPNARFTGGDFKLTKSARYFALSQREREKPGLIKTPDKGNITVDYAGQRQIASGRGYTSHLGDYDFMVSTGVCSPEVEDQVYFDFQHLGYTMYITINNLPEGAKYKKLEIYDSKNVYRKTVRTIDLSKGLNATTGNYAPAFNAEDVQSEEYKTAPRFSLLLGEDKNNNYDNADDEGITVGSDKKLELFVELPPVDMTDNTFVFTLVPSDGGTPYYVKCDGQFYKREYKAGYAYMMSGDAKPVDQFNVRLRINHDWQLGNAVPVSRATGDPGVEDKYAKPNYIYYVFCVDGKVKQVNNNYYNSVTISNPEQDWTTSSDKVFDTYKDDFTFSVEDTEKDKSKNVYLNVYFVASTSDLSSSFSGITSSTTEAEIQNLVYSIQNASSSHKALDASQTFLRDLYSTPWESQSTFIGALKDPYQDVILYHVSAKVDLKWNSSAMLSGNVSVNNVMSTNLSLFKPTNNSSAESANYTVTNAIDEETMFNGRQVFYLPQFKTYNVTVGNKDAEDVTFSPATTNGFTSWLRWQRKY